MQKQIPENAILVPDNAVKVFTGQIFDVYQWPQTMFDGRTETFEMLRRPDTVQVLAIKDNKIVMIQDHQPHKGERLGIPGGRTDETDADWLEAAKRELLEETGLSFRQWRLVQVVQPQPKIEWFGVVYLAWDFEAEVAQNHDAGGEKIVASLIDFSEAKTLVLDGQVLGFLRPLFDKAHSIDDLLALPEYKGTRVER